MSSDLVSQLRATPGTGDWVMIGAPGQLGVDMAPGLRPCALTQHQVDMTGAQRQITLAAEQVAALHLLEAHLQAQRTGHGGRHHHQRQAVAAARGKGLGGIAGDAGVIVQLQPAGLVQRFTQGQRQVGRTADLAAQGLQVGQHRRAEGQHGIGIGRARWLVEQVVVQQGLGWRWRQAGATGQPCHAQRAWQAPQTTGEG